MNSQGPAREHAAESTPARTVVGMVPHVTVAAYCETAETAEAVHAAFGDRRLARAHTTVETGGIPTAVTRYGEAPVPNVLIVESRVDRYAMLADLARLAEVCTPDVKVLVLGHVNDVLLYRELMRQGVGEYLVAPADSLQIIETLVGFYADPEAAPLGRVYAFIGAKGGVGSSTIAHNVGWAISETLAEDVVITDLDLAFGTAGLNFNQDPAQGIADALGASDRIDASLVDRLLTRCNDHLSILAGPGTVEREHRVDSVALDSVLAVVRHSVPCVIVDMPTVWAPWTRQTLVQADDVVITATPDLACLRNAKNLVDMLRLERPNDQPPRVVLNQVGVPKRAEIAPQDFAKTLELEPAAVIPYEPQIFATAANNGQMLGEIAATAKATVAIMALASLVTGRAPAARPGRFGLGSLLERLSAKRSA